MREASWLWSRLRETSSTCTRGEGGMDGLEVRARDGIGFKLDLEDREIHSWPGLGLETPVLLWSRVACTGSLKRRVMSDGS